MCDTAALTGVSLPTVDRWVDRYEAEGFTVPWHYVATLRRHGLKPHRQGTFKLTCVI